MTTYKYTSPDNTVVHVIDADGVSRSSMLASALPQGVTPEPYVALAATPLEQIAAIEAANPITHRNLRDLSMTVAQIAAAVTGTDPMVNPAVQQIALLQTTIDALREQARAEGLIP